MRAAQTTRRWQRSESCTKLKHSEWINRRSNRSQHFRPFRIAGAWILCCANAERQSERFNAREKEAAMQSLWRQKMLRNDIRMQIVFGVKVVSNIYPVTNSMSWHYFTVCSFDCSNVHRQSENITEKCQCVVDSQLVHSYTQYPYRQNTLCEMWISEQVMGGFNRQCTDTEKALNMPSSSSSLSLFHNPKFSIDFNSKPSYHALSSVMCRGRRKKFSDLRTAASLTNRIIH